MNVSPPRALVISCPRTLSNPPSPKSAVSLTWISTPRKSSGACAGVSAPFGPVITAGSYVPSQRTMNPPSVHHAVGADGRGGVGPLTTDTPVVPSHWVPTYPETTPPVFSVRRPLSMLEYGSCDFRFR